MAKNSNILAYRGHSYSNHHIPIHNSLKGDKIPMNKPHQGSKGPDNEKFKPLKKEIKTLEKLNNILCSWISRINILKITIFT